MSDNIPPDGYTPFTGLRVQALVTQFIFRNWENETLLPSEVEVGPLFRAYKSLVEEKTNAAIGSLTSMLVERLAPYPSYLMRWHYAMALTHMQLGREADARKSLSEYRLACDSFNHALDIALQWGDRESQFILIRMHGEALHELLKYDQALDDYQSALSLLRKHKLWTDRERALTEIYLRNLIARQLFLVGRFHAGQVNINIARKMRLDIGATAMESTERIQEDWTEALILRGVSQSRGGDPQLLDTARKNFRRIQEHLDAANPEDPSRIAMINRNRSRILIQLAGTYLDFAQYYRAQGHLPSYRVNLEQAMTYGVKASDALHATTDESGQKLATLVLLRHDFLSLKASELAAEIRAVKHGVFHPHALTPRIEKLKQQGLEKDDLLLVAQATTLRADVLLAIQEPTQALATYYEALNAFERAHAAGESTRALYGVRRILELV